MDWISGLFESYENIPKGQAVHCSRPYIVARAHSNADRLWRRRRLDAAVLMQSVTTNPRFRGRPIQPNLQPLTTELLALINVCQASRQCA